MDLKQQIQDLPIQNIISEYVTLEKTGANNFVGRCPFHTDKHPSLRVNGEKKLFKCFACGAGGDAITFVKEYFHISFMEALQTIARAHNLDTSQFPAPAKSNEEIKILRDITEIYYLEGKDKPLMDAFLKERNISKATADVFKMGMAPENDVVIEYFKRNDIPSQVGLNLGLIRQEGSGFRDVFKNRYMFPIYRDDGQPCGFSGRAILPDQQPKYMNSKSSEIFNKSELLFGFHINKKKIMEENSVILVEGYMDLVSLYEHGIRNAVAVMGTTISGSNITKLSKCAENFVIGFDSDPAGLKAGERIADMLLQEGIIATKVNYLPWKDPDEFLRNELFGNIQLTKRIIGANTFLDEKLAAETQSFRILGPFMKLSILQVIFSELQPLGDCLSAHVRIIHYAKVLGIESDQSFLIESYRNFLKGNIK